MICELPLAHYCRLKIITPDQLAGRSQRQELGGGRRRGDIAERDRTKDQGSKEKGNQAAKYLIK